jgi:23S rRNA pseudouridine2605 synthase
MKRKTDNFSKFFNRKRTSAVKEEIRQEKKLVKKERREAVDRHFEEKRNKRAVSTSLNTVPVKEQKAGGSGAKIPINKTAVLPHNKKSDTVSNDKRPAALQNDIAANNNRASIPQNNATTLPLNKYVAHAGVSSRRASAILVKEGKVTVNGIVVTDPGTKVLYTDTVKVNGKKVTVSSHFVYILLNKPKDFLTTTTDPQGRKTVQQLISKATEERVYPIGRLDRNTSGVLLFTNDGDLAQKLSHPKNEMKKVYHVGLDKPLTKQHFEKIMGGIELEDGQAKVDEMAYADPKDKTQIGLEIHSGKNRIVRRIFAALGYDVKTLDRVMYAGLTKKNVQRGNWRFLTEKEIRALKYLKS